MSKNFNNIKNSKCSKLKLRTFLLHVSHLDMKLYTLTLNTPEKHLLLLFFCQCVSIISMLWSWSSEKKGDLAYRYIQRISLQTWCWLLPTTVVWLIYKLWEMSDFVLWGHWGLWSCFICVWLAVNRGQGVPLWPIFMSF